MDNGPIPPGQFAFICIHTSKMQEPILMAVRDEPIDEEDSGWVFSCLREDHVNEDWQLVLPNRYFAADPSLRDLLTMPVGYIAVRQAPDQPWDLRPRETAEE